MTFHLETITPEQQAVLWQMGPVVSAHGFYLAGGTAVALHLGHRRSVDFDWFTNKASMEPMPLAQRLRDEGISFTTGQVAPGTLHGTISGVRVSFLEYRYPLLNVPVNWPEPGCSVASLDDLACMKLSAIAQRGAKKDFIDLYALLRQHRPLSVLLDLYRQKYSTDDIAHLLYALAYFDDADREQTPFLLWDIAWPTVKQVLRRQVKTLVS